MTSPIEARANQEPITRYKPCAVVLTSPPLHGKSRLADIIASKSNFFVLDVDNFRNQIDPENLTRGGMHPNPEEEARLVREAYILMCQTARQMILNEGASVILAATFSTPDKKEPLLKLKGELDKQGVPVKFFYLKASEEEIQRRINERNKEGSASNIRNLKDYLWARDTLYKPFTTVPVTEIDTEDPTYTEIVSQRLEDLKI